MPGRMPMTYGTADWRRVGQGWGSHTLYVQEKPHHGFGGVWGAHSEHHYPVRAGKKPCLISALVPFSNCMERGVPAGGITRGEHALRVLEENHSRGEDAPDTAEFKKSIKRKYQDGRCQSPRFVLGDQPIARDGYADAEGASPAKKICRHHRRAAHDALRNSVFQALGGCIIAEWLTPVDMYHMKCATRLDWSWARVWHHGRVKQPSVAAKIELCLKLGYHVDDILCRWTIGQLMQALWHLVTAAEFSRLALEYKHIPSMRKLH